MPVRFDFMVRGYIEQTNVMSEYAKAASMTGNIVIEGQPVGTSWIGVDANLFSLLDIKPAFGRGFLPGKDVAGSDHVIVVTHQFWHQHLGGKKEALGRQITVGDAICTVVGVLLEGQLVPAYFYNDVYRPLVYKVDSAQPWLPALFLLGKARPGVTREQATAVLTAAKRAVPAMMRPFLTNDHPALSTMAEVNKLFRDEIYWVMLGAVAFLYAVACLNASNLMLVRMLGQRRELSIRLALGGGRWRIIRLLALESVTLAVLASLASSGCASHWALPGGI